MSLAKRIASSPVFHRAAGTAGAWYLRFVWYTSRKFAEPATIYDTADMPVILAMWHGQHFIMPFVQKDDPRYRAKVLVSRHRDGEIKPASPKSLVSAPSAVPAHTSMTSRARAFRQMLRALDQGYNVAMTADVPKVGRVAGLGPIKLAQHSGRPIYPGAITSHRRIVLNNWDRTVINLPFSRIGFVAGEPIRIPRQADEATLEAARQQLENELNRITARAYELADKPGSKPA
jgi:lysophospholipid acyltransferase (LPLAT)-like uncharacterized protein